MNISSINTSCFIFRIYIVYSLLILLRIDCYFSVLYFLFYLVLEVKIGRVFLIIKAFVIFISKMTI